MTKLHTPSGLRIRRLPIAGAPMSRWLLILALAGEALGASSQSPLSIVPPPGPNSTGANAAIGQPLNKSGTTLEARLAEARAELDAGQLQSRTGLPSAPAGISAEDAARRSALLHRLVILYEQQQDNITSLARAQDRTQDISREAQTWERFEQSPPYSVLLADQLREDLQTQQLKIQDADAAESMFNRLIEENRRILAQADERIRQLNEQLESSLAMEATVRLEWQRDLEKLRSEVAAASVGLLDSERRVRIEELKASRIRIGLLQRQLVVAESSVRFAQADLELIRAKLQREGDELSRELAIARPKSSEAAVALASARDDLQRLQARPATELKLLDRAEELVSLRVAQLDTADAVILALRQQLDGTSVGRSMWELRFVAHNTPELKSLRESEQSLEGFVRRLELWKDYYRQQLEVTSSAIQLQQTRLGTIAADSEIAALVREQLATLHERDQALLRMFRAIERWGRQLERWSESLRTASGKLPFTSRVQHLFFGTRGLLERLWTFELFAAEDTITVEGQEVTGRRSVTVGKVATAILILTIGYWLTGLIARLAEPVLVRRLKFEANQAKLIGRWVRFGLVAALILFSLISVKIPLTVFAFAGGALAIGLGFGMQTMIKNFVSGLILLLERPLRVGDVLDVGGQRGTITSIGLRASVLHAWDGTEVLIPNSSLLEGNVTNWTYSHRRIRFTVSVGVAYGSDPRRVIDLLNEVAQRHGLVEKDPKPQVLFTEFGDNSLNFEMRYWVDIAKSSPPQVASDLRLMIAAVFAEHGIVIAFPQRDIHLDTTRPLQVEVVSPPDPEHPKQPEKPSSTPT